MATAKKPAQAIKAKEPQNRITSEKPAKATKTKEPQNRITSEMLPRLSLSQSLKVAEVLHTTYAGKSAPKVAIAKVLATGMNSINYAISSAQSYGIVNRENTDVYSLSELGRKIVAPAYEQESIEGIRKAILTPTLLSKFYSKYNNHPLPSEIHFPIVLERSYGVPPNRVRDAVNIILENATYGKILDSSFDPPILRLLGIETTQSETQDVSLSIKSSEAISISEDKEWMKICFYITPIGDEGSDVRKHSDMLLKHLLEPVFNHKFDLKVIRADKIEKSGFITKQIFEHLAFARLCVVDLSFGNPNAFYELGVRHVFRLPTIQIIRKGDRIPFDVSQGRTIVIDTSDIYTIMDRLESAQRELAEHVKHILSSGAQDGAQENPVNVHLPGLKVILPK
jgi:hypothetical protein